MSWLGGSLSSLTGQLTNLTKDILTEGTEEVSDHATELRLAQQKLSEIQSTYAAQKSECERLKRISHQYEENAESAELQINAISREYRTLLEEKEKEIKELKRRHHELLEQQAKTALLASSDSVELSLTHSTSTPLISKHKDAGYEAGGFHIQDDGWEFGDSISLQHEVNRLSHEIQRLQAECQHWRSVAGQLGHTGSENEQLENKKEELVELQATVQELKKQLSEARDHQQHEVASLQDVHAQKISTLKKKHKQEVTEYKQQIAYLEQLVSEGRDNDSVKNGRSSNLPEADRANLDDQTNLVESLTKELSALQNEFSVVTKEKQEAIEAKQQMEQVLQELEVEVKKLKEERENHLKKIEELDQLVSQLKDDLKNTNITEDVLKEEIERLQQENVELVEVNRQQLEVKENITCLNSKSANVSGEVAAIVEGMGSSEQQYHTAELVNTIEKENMILKEQNLKLQEQVTLLEKASQQQMSEKSSCEETIVKLQKELTKINDPESTDTFSTLEQNLETDEESRSEDSGNRVSELEASLHKLTEEVDKYKKEISDFEMVRSDWLMEKEAVDDVLLQLREQLQTKDDLLTKAEDQKMDLETKVNKLQEELSHLDQTLKEEKSTKSDLLSQVNDLENRLTQQGDTVSLLQQDKLDLETSLEELDMQHQEATDKLIQMRDKLLTDISTLHDQMSQREDEISQLKAGLETSRLQTSSDEVDSSRLKKEEEEENEMEGEDTVKYLQEKIQQLDRKIESLKSELNVKEREIEDLKEKGRRGAVAVNELHMDKQDLEEKLLKSKQETENKVLKIKELREENTKLIDANKTLKKRLQEMEEDLEEWQQVNEDYQVQRSQSENAVLEMKQLATENSQLTNKLNNAEKTCREIHIRNTELVAENEKLYDLVRESEKQTNEKAQNVIESLESNISNLKTQLDAVSSEKISLQNEIDHLEQKMEEKNKHYENYIQDLQNSKELDADSIKQEHQNLMETCHKKEIEIVELKSQIQTLHSEISDVKETLTSSVDSQNQMSEILVEKQTDFDHLKEEYDQLVAKCDECNERLKEQDILIESMKNLETQLAGYKNECQKLRMEIEQSKAEIENKPDDKPQTLEIITQLEKELSVANSTLVQLRSQMSEYENTISDLQSQVKQLTENNEDYKKLLEQESERRTEQEELVSALQQESAAKDAKIADLENQLSSALSSKEHSDSIQQELSESCVSEHQNNGYQQSVDTIEDISEPDGKFRKEMTQNYFSVSEKEVDYSENFKQMEKVSREMDELRGKLKEKDKIIEELQTNNSSLLKMLDAKTPSQENKTKLEINKLENEVKSLKMEKEQILAVMNEKTRECSSSKAEIHRLMSVISAEKSALEKLQRDNHQLNQTKDTSEKEDMQREALQTMSRLVRDKEMEIEALKQKNETLLEVLQNSSSENSNEKQIHSLLQDKENLGKQVKLLQNEREQMIIYLNQKHQESVTYHNEIQRLNAYINSEKETFEKLQRDYESLVPQFEDQKQALIKAQNELLNYEQKYRELEVKYGEVIQRTNVTDTVDIVTFNTKEEELKRCQEKLEELSNCVNEKDRSIQVLTQKMFELENSISDKDVGRTNLKKQVENLTFQLQGLQTELLDSNKELETCRQKAAEQSSENQMLNELNNQITLSLREKEFELSSIREKSGTLQTLLQTQQGEKGQVDHMIQENEALHNQCVQLQQERDQLMLALKQRQKENEELMQEIEKLKEREQKVNRELDRLRHHLLQIEEAYTQEALDAEEREKDLRNRLAVAEEKLLSSSAAVAHASQTASQQVESLQQQLYTVSSQRDAAYTQLTTMQDQCQQYSVSLANLQMVLEQFQKEKDVQVAAETEQYATKIKSLTDEVNSLKNQLINTQTELEEASKGLEAASRLSEQLDRREEAITALKEEVQLREKALKTAEEELRKLSSSTEAKIDKLLMKNMLLGYFTTPQNKRKEVFQMIGGVLNFTHEDFEKVDSSGKQGWVSGWLHLGSAHTTPPTTPVRQVQSPGLNQSFSQLFVKFLERESSPPPPPVRMPAEDMARELQEKHKDKETHKPVFNPFTAPRHVSMPVQIGGAQMSASTSHILMSSTTPSSLPLFQPMSEESITQSSSGRSTPQNSSAILKDVLGSR